MSADRSVCVGNLRHQSRRSCGDFGDDEQRFPRPCWRPRVTCCSLSYGTDHRRRTEPPDDRTGSPCHLSVPWSTSIWYTRTGPRVVDAVLVNQSDCAVKMLWWRPLASSCARNVINHVKHTGNCWRRHLDSVIRHSQQAGAPRLRK